MPNMCSVVGARYPSFGVAMRWLSGWLLLVAGALAEAASESAAAVELAAAEQRAELLRRAAVTERWQPQPQRVVPGSVAGAPPADALVLFDGSDLSAFRGADAGAAPWRLVDGAVEVVPGSGDIETIESFGDIQLHIEWRAPPVVVSSGQGRGNSGVFLMSHYEVQILDSYDNETYANGQAASVYKQHIPLVNAARAPGEWQSYDVIFRAPRFNGRQRVSQPATLTVFHNGVLVQDHVVLSGSTEFIGAPSYTAHGEAPLRLQDHGNLVRFRNIWLRRL